MRLAAALAAAVAVLSSPGALADAVTVSHAIAEFGEPKYGADFTHFDYASPDAPKGGRVTFASSGSFDSLNFLPVRDEAVRSIGLIYDTLMVQAQDDLSVYYPLVAESVEYPADRSWAIFNLRAEARFHDGTPLTAKDVAWSFEAIKEHGNPFLKAEFDDVTAAEVLDDHRIRFRFSTTGRMQPLTSVAEEIPILPRHYWEEPGAGRDISRSFLDPPLGGGPYRLVRVDAGRQVVYERVRDYWAANLPVRRGHWNFNRIVVDYYRDRTILFEAFKAGEYDWHRSFSSREWGAGFDFPAFEDGSVMRTEFPVVNFRGIQGFMFNTRLPLFANIRVREALNYLYPFEWVNQNVMYGLYRRSESYFPHPDYTAAAGPPTGRELELLKPFRDRLPPELFTQPFRLPVNDALNISRDNLRSATRLLEEAGWVIRDQRLVNAETGEPFEFEIVLRSSSTLEPHTQPWIRNLERVGINATIRLVDGAQYQARYQDREFDALVLTYTFYPPPGTEMRNRFGSAAADVAGSANLMGIKDPVVDALIEQVIAAQDLESKQAATRAVDRVLLHGHYLVPHWTNSVAWVAYWDRFGFPDIIPEYNFAYSASIGFQPTWWIDPEKDALLAEAN